MAEIPKSMLPPHNIPYRMKLLTLLNERRLLSVLEPHNLTPMQYGVLCCLWQGDGRTTSEISENLKALGGTLTVVLDGLESRDLVERIRQPEDKRISRVFLTKTGNKLKSSLLPKVLDLQLEMYQCLSETEKKFLSDILDRLLINSQPA